MSVHAALPVLTRRPHTPVVVDSSDARFPEVMLYLGNACNRECSFCCVDGSPAGLSRPFTPAVVRSLLERIRPDARIKLYGGEPTLHHRHLIRVVRSLRSGGYIGRLTVFSNGVQARRLIEMLESDPPAEGHPGSDAYLNHAIWNGRGAPPIPAGRRRILLEWAVANPGRLFLGHDDILPVGAAERPVARAGPLADAPDFGGHCARCFPTLRSDGTVHACAFAAEVRSVVYDLGRIEDGAREITDRRARFLRFIDEVVEPEAARLGEPACRVCLSHARASSLRAGPD